MIQINLKIRPDLRITSGSGKISVVISKKSGNGLKLEGDGLYMEDRCGMNDDGFIDQSGNGLRIGFDGPYSVMTAEGEYPKPGRVSANNVVHHIYTMDSDLKTIIGFREVDCILPGDIIRVPVSSIKDAEADEQNNGIGAVEEANIVAAETTARSVELTAGFQPRLTIPANGNKFYIRKANGGYSDAIPGSPLHSNLTVLNNCVGYAFGRFNEIDNNTSMSYCRPSMPGDWIGIAKSQGLEVGMTPRVGAVVVWVRGGNSGHVAVVEEVIDSNHIRTSESGYGCKSSFWVSDRTNEGGNWGGYTLKGFIYHPNVSASVVPDSNGAQTASTHYVPINPVDWKLEQKNGIYYVEGILICNKTYKLPKDYNPGVQSEAQAAVNEMIAAAKKDGVTLSVCSGFRSYSSQKSLFEGYASREGGGSSGYAEAETYSARPGHSEHQTGLAFDMNKASRNENGSKWANWIVANSWKYGLINRYPAGKEAITGYNREDWHVRYVGKEWAKKIHDSGLCLEEYFGLPSKYTKEYNSSDY